MPDDKRYHSIRSARQSKACEQKQAAHASRPDHGIRFVLVLIAGFLLATPPALSATVKRLAALEFANKLVLEYPASREQAFLKYFDSALMLQRTFEPLADAHKAQGIVKLWEDSLYPGVQAEFKRLGIFEILQVSRILLIDGERGLEMLFTDKQGRFQLVTFWLGLDQNGGVKILDFRLLGSALECTRRMRHLFLFLGAPFTLGLDAEEQDIVSNNIGAGVYASSALRSAGQGHLDESFRHWDRIQGKMRETRLWRDYRDGLANARVKEAMTAIDQEWQQGRLQSAFLCFVLAQQKRQLTAASAALDSLIHEQGNAPFLRTLRAGLAIERGEMAKAFTVLREIYRSNPHCANAFGVATLAAVRIGDFAAAKEVLDEWALVVPAREIATILAADPGLGEFRASTEYLNWSRQQALAPSPAGP